MPERFEPFSIQEQKARLRAQMKKHVALIAANRREALSRALCARLQEQAVWRQAGSVLLYAPMLDEPNILPMTEIALSSGRVVAFPRFVNEENGYAPCRVKDPSNDLVAGKYGIAEPSPACQQLAPDQLDLILVPGLAYTLDGHRLGRGGGYYDRLLATLRGFACGTAYDEQIVSNLPAEPHDLKLSCILTPTRWHQVASPRAVPE